MTIVFLIFFSCISAILYRMGGCSPSDLQAEWGWVPAPIRNFPKKRDVGCSIAWMLAAGIVGITGPWWAWLLAFGISWGALSSYWDPLFGYDNFYMHGFGVGFAAAPLAMLGVEPLALLIRMFLVALLMGVWSQATGDAKAEELGRGFVIPLTLGLAVVL